MQFKLIKAATLTLFGLGLTVTTASADSTNWTTPTAITAGYMDAAKWMEPKPLNVTTVGVTIEAAASSDARMNVVNGTFFDASDEVIQKAKVVTIVEGFGNNPFYRGTDRLGAAMMHNVAGTDRLSTMKYAVTPLYGTDRLIQASGYDADIDAEWNTGTGWTNSEGFKGFGLRATHLRGTDRI